MQSRLHSRRVTSTAECSLPRRGSGSCVTSEWAHCDDQRPIANRLNQYQSSAEPAAVYGRALPCCNLLSKAFYVCVGPLLVYRAWSVLDCVLGTLVMHDQSCDNSTRSDCVTSAVQPQGTAICKIKAIHHRVQASNSSSRPPLPFLVRYQMSHRPCASLLQPNHKADPFRCPAMSDCGGSSPPHTTPKPKTPGLDLMHPCPLLPQVPRDPAQ